MKTVKIKQMKNGLNEKNIEWNPNQMGKKIKENFNKHKY